MIKIKGNRNPSPDGRGILSGKILASKAIKKLKSVIFASFFGKQSFVVDR
jgi:hypothetical protein